MDKCKKHKCCKLKSSLKTINETSLMSEIKLLDSDLCKIKNKPSTKTIYEFSPSPSSSSHPLYNKYNAIKKNHKCYINNCKNFKKKKILNCSNVNKNNNKNNKNNKIFKKTNKNKCNNNNIANTEIMNEIYKLLNV